VVSTAALTAADQIQAFAAPGHACTLIEHNGEHLELIARFARIGLERAEQCVFLHAEGNEAPLVRALHEHGIDVEAARQANALVLISPRDVNIRGDAFDPYRLLRFWKRLASQTRAAGFNAMRCAIAMSSFAVGTAEADRWLEYEAQLTELAENYRCLFLCHYPRRAFGPRWLLDAVRSHSSIVHGSGVAPNLYYVPSWDAAERDADVLALESILDVSRRAWIERRLNVALISSAVPFSILSAIRNKVGTITDFVWEYVNPAAARVIGKNTDELIDRAILEVFPRAWTASGLFECFVRVVETGQQASREASLTTDGRTRWWQNIVSKLDDGVAVWFPEITERKEAEETLRRRQVYLDDGERLSHTGSWGWDIAAQDISFWSPGLFRIVGLDPDTRPTYAQLRRLIHPDDLSFVESNFARAVREHAGFDHEFRIIQADGMRHLRSVGHPVLNAQGVPVEYAGTIIDVTAQREAEAALRTAQATLARVARLTTLGELSTSIAHEVNQPLAAIVLHGDAARRWLGHTPANVREALHAIEGMMTNAHRAREVIARIRALAIEADQPREVLDLNALVRDVLEIASGELRQFRILVRSEFGAGLAVVGDRVQLQQVLLNLIMNAIEAMNTGEQRSRELFIRTSHDSEQRAHIEVRDSGPGVSEGSLQRIFDPFYTTKAQGTGIGLSISRTIIEAHNGRLWAESNATPPGLTLHIVLPCDICSRKALGDEERS
jgi:PAS domain S-box-containing protein